MEKAILHWNGQSSVSCGYLQLYLRLCFWKHLKVQPDLSQSCNNNCFFQKSSCSVLWHIWFLTPRFLFFLIKAVKDVFCKVFLTHASTKLYFSAKSMFFYEISRKKRKSYNPQDHLCKCISRLHEDDLCVSQYDTGFALMVQMTDSLFFCSLAGSTIIFSSISMTFSEIRHSPLWFGCITLSERYGVIIFYHKELSFCKRERNICSLKYVPKRSMKCSMFLMIRT